MRFAHDAERPLRIEDVAVAGEFTPPSTGRPSRGGPFRHAGLFSESNSFSRVMFFSHVPLR